MSGRWTSARSSLPVYIWDIWFFDFRKRACGIERGTSVGGHIKIGHGGLGLFWALSKILGTQCILKILKIDASGMTHLLLCMTDIDLPRYVRNRFVPSASLRRSIGVPGACSKAMVPPIRPSHLRRELKNPLVGTLCARGFWRLTLTRS